MAGALDAANGPAPTYKKDVAPILARLTDEESRAWAKSIRFEILAGAMPPWHAGPRYGQVSNENRLTEDEIKTVVEWVDQGRARGRWAIRKRLHPFPSSSRAGR